MSMLNQKVLFQAASVLFISTIFTGCANSPAPGCNTSLLPIIGGCSGKTAIIDISHKPAVPCLTIRANNCNGGILEIRNRCSAALVFKSSKNKAVVGNIIIQPDSDENFDLIKNNDNIYLSKSDSGNFSIIRLKQNHMITLDALLGSIPVRISFTKTAPLCQ